MTENPLISVLCARYNHEKYVGYFIHSLINQTYSNWELIIVDDCSTDNNVEEIKKINDSRIHLYQQEYNQGPGAALNKAFSKSKGEIIIDMASDDSLKCDYFEFVVKTFKEKSEVNISQILNNTPNDLIYCINENNAPKINSYLISKKQ